MAILKIHCRLQQERAKLALYLPVVSQPLPLPQVFSFVRIGGQLTGELSTVHTQTLTHLCSVDAANDPIY